MKADEAKLMRQIGKKLKSLRLRKGFSLPDAAANLKIKKETLEKIEAGKTNYNLVLFVKICKKYNVDPKKLIT